MNNGEIFNILIKTDPFEMLDEESLRDLADKVEIRTYPANTYVFRQGNPGQDTLFVIGSGLAEITVTNDRGDEAVVALLRACDFFGETVVFSRRRYPGSVRAKEQLCCCLISRQDLEHLIYRSPEFSGFFNALLAERLRMLYAEMSMENACGAVGDSESGFFRRRVSEIMAYPVITCGMEDLVTNASKLIADRDINAVVAVDREKRPRGILTEKSLVTSLIARQAYPVETCRVSQVMRSDLVEIQPNAFISQALVAMIRGKTKHLIVTERKEMVGILSMVDLARTRSAGTLLLTRDIESQPDMGGLILIGREMKKILTAMVRDNAAIHEIFDVMSELRERLTRRVIQLSEEGMCLDGWGTPPAEYCWINTGSSARYEQTFGTGLDNAIIYATPDGEASAAASYFERFARKVIRGLESCGLGECSPDTAAVYARWRNSLSGWMKAIDRWGATCMPDHTRSFFTLLDYRPVWGNMALAQTFREILFDRFRDYLTKGPEISGSRTGYEQPIRFLGTFQIEKSGPYRNKMNLKTSALMPLVNGIRILAAANRIPEPSTLGRIRLLSEGGIISRDEGAIFARSFETLILLKLQATMKLIDAGESIHNYIDPYSLRKRERMELKDALAGVSQVLETVYQQVPFMDSAD